jgi:hypothetical protein
VAQYPPLRVDVATRDEVLAKSDRQINVETAYKWAARAVVSFSEFARTKSLEWLLRAEDYRHEALEHAALVGDDGELTSHLERAMGEVRPAYRVEL